MDNLQTPLWLDIKPQYIDENFDRVLEYLHSKSSMENDSFYGVTVDLMEKRVSRLLEEQYCIPLYKEDTQSYAEMQFAVKLLAAYLLLGTQKCKNDYNWFSQVYVVMLKNLFSLTSKDMSTDFLLLTIDAIKGKVSIKMPYGWGDLKDFSPDIFSHKLVSLQTKSKEECPGGTYEGKGLLYIDKDNVNIAACSKQELTRKQLVATFTAFEGKFNIMTSKADKLKQSEHTNIASLETFVRNFITNQRNVAISKPKLKIYDKGDELKVRVVAKEGLKVRLESIAPEYEKVSGPLICNDLDKLGYYERDFYNYLNVDDVLCVRYTQSGMDISYDIKKHVIEEEAPIGDTFTAKVTKISNDSRGYPKVFMWSNRGFPVQCFLNQCRVSDIQEEDYVKVVVTGYGKDRYYGVVNVEVIELSDEEIDFEASKEELIQNAVYDEYVEPEKKTSNEFSPISIKSLCLMLVKHQRVLAQPSDRYKLLCVARILAELIDNRQDSEYIEFISDYLENLVHFAKGNYDNLFKLHPSVEFAQEEGVGRRMQIIDILMAYGKDDSNEVLDDIINGSNDPLLKKIAILVLSCNRIDDVISKAMQNVIKREITKYLAVETEGETDLEEENGSYLGIENSRQEFKTSFFYAPAKAKEQNQEINVFKGVCAFLNSPSGGILYIGVNDLGYVNGIAPDLEYMKKKVYGAYSGIDGYIRYITDRAKAYFGLGVATHIEINPMYDNQVVALNIRPYEFNVVELEGTAYLRLNNESVVMTESMKRQMLGKRVLSNKEKAANISMLLEAIKDNRKVILKNYSSSNSRTITDRNVEPYAFTENHKHIWCYDLDKKENRVFNTARIGNVEILEEKWTYTQYHKQGKLDIFGMTGNTPIKVVMELGMMARNILIEEYPQAKKFIISTKSPDKWLLDIEVYQMEGVARFYIGLAEDITILNAPELVEYVKNYKKYI